MKHVAGVIGAMGLWLAPLIVVFEFLGSTFGAPLPATFGLVALFLAGLWLAEPPTDPPPAAALATRGARTRLWAARAVGAALILVGAALFAPALTPLWTHHAATPSALARKLGRPEWLTLLPLLGAWPIAFGWAGLRGGRLCARDFERLGLLASLGFVALLAGRVRVQNLPVLPYRVASIDVVLLAIAVLIALLAAVPRIPTLARLGVLVVAAVTLRGIGLGAWQIDPATRDMLALAKSAQDAFVSGHDPYAIYQMQHGSEVPLTYLPGMWLLHGLPRLIGLDLRWAGILADVGVVSALAWASGGVVAERRAAARSVALGLSAVWLFSPSVHWNGVYAEPHVWWGVLALLVAATLRRAWWAVASLLALAVLTRHFALVLAPFVALAMLRDLGPVRTLLRLGVAGGVGAALLIAFVARDSSQFWFGTLRWLIEYGPVHQTWFYEKFGFTGTLYRTGHAEWLARGQAVIVVGMLVLACFVRSPRLRLAAAGSALLGFVMFNGIVWDSFYLDPFLFVALLGTAGRSADADSPAPTAVSSRHTARVALAAGVLLFAQAAWLGHSLWRSHDRRGREAMREYLTRTLLRSDALIDRSDLSLAFVHGQFLFERAAPAGSVGYDLLDPRFGGSGALPASRVFFVTRDDRDDAPFRQLAWLGESVADQHFGRYRVRGVIPRAVTARFAESFSSLTVTLTRPGAAAQPLARDGARFIERSLPYLSVEPRRCRVGGAQRPMIFAHPADVGALALAFRDVPLGKALLVYAGLDDSAVAWGRADVDVDIALDDRHAGHLFVENRPHAVWTVLDTSALSGPHRVELTLRTKDAAQRWLCIDAWVY